MEFCQVQDCPEGSECRNLNHGYECVANVTLHDSLPVSFSIILEIKLNPYFIIAFKIKILNILL